MAIEHILLRLALLVYPVESYYAALPACVVFGVQYLHVGRTLDVPGYGFKLCRSHRFENPVRRVRSYRGSCIHAYNINVLYA